MASALTHFTYNTPVGHITIASNGTAITEIAFGVRTLAGEKRATELTNRAANQLRSTSLANGARLIFLSHPPEPTSKSECGPH